VRNNFSVLRHSHPLAGITGVYAGYANHVNLGAIMEKGVRLIGNGQAPVHRWWKEILSVFTRGSSSKPYLTLKPRNDYLLTGKIKPSELFVTHKFVDRFQLWPG
jgi:hypothetical protein